MTDPRDIERAKRRNLNPGCAIPAAIPAVAISPPARPVSNCDVPPTIAADAFDTPGATVAATDISTDIPLIHITSAAVTVNCSDVEGAGPVGESVTINAGQIARDISWHSFAGISASQLAFIATLNPLDVTTTLTQSTAEAVAGAFRLALEQAVIVRTAALTALAAANAQARAIAVATLTCGWVNERQETNCAAGAYHTANDPAHTALNPSVISAGSSFSSQSQNTANAQALAAAFSAMVCVYPNTEQTVTCLDAGFGEEVPVDAAPWPALDQMRVGIITVPAGRVLSSDSAADADQQARTLGLSQLSCFAINEFVAVSCSASGKPGTDDTIISNLTSGVPGNSVEVPQGYLASTTSTADANALAHALAMSLLQCRWTNSEIVVQCPVQYVPDPRNPGATVLLNPSDKSPSIQFQMAAGSYYSEVSQVDADQQAMDAALAQLSCLYCNQDIAPTCVPEAIAQQVREGVIPLPIPAAMVTSAWSSDATLGLAANTYCDTDASVVEMTAGSALVAPAAIPTNDCKYGNDAQTLHCPSGMVAAGAADLSGVFIVPAGTFVVSVADVPPTFRPGETDREKAFANAQAAAFGISTLSCSFQNAARSFTCSQDKGMPHVHPTSLGLDSAPLVIPAGQFTSLNSQAEVDAETQAYGMSQLLCFYMNRRMTVLCGDSPADEFRGGGYSDTGDRIAITYGTGSMTPKDGSSPKATVDVQSMGAVGNPVQVEADTILDWHSQQDADQAALTLGLNSLNCFWSNVDVSVTCGAPVKMPWVPGNALDAPITAGLGIGDIGHVPAGAFISDISIKAASSTAYAVAYGIPYCFNIGIAFDSGLVGNEEYEADECGEGQHHVGVINVPENTFKASTKTAADKITADFIDANTICEPDAAGSAGNTEQSPAACTPIYLGYGVFSNSHRVGLTKIPAGTFKAVTIEEADTMAADFLLANTSCDADVTVDVLVDLRLAGGKLQGKYKTVTVTASVAASPEWRDMVTTMTSSPATCP